MPRSVVTGVGVVTPATVGCAATTAALRAGAVLRPPPGGAAITLCPEQVDEALRDRLVGVPGARPASWRGTGVGLRAGLLAAVEAAVGARLLDPELSRDGLGLVVAGHNLTTGLAEQMAAKFATAPAYVPPSAAVRMWDTDTVGLVSQLLRLGGEAALVGGASASGLVAVNHAHHLVTAGVVRACLVVAPALQLTDWQRQALLAAGAMRGAQPSAADPGRPFDRSRDGFVPSELAAAVVVEDAGHAAGRGATVWACQVGAATRLAGSSGAEPDAHAEREVVLTALRRAGLDPAVVDYVNTHGTASRRGDSCELAALGGVFTDPPGPWANSTKALLGHGLTAAGLVEYVATVLQLRHGFVHPMPYLTEPLPHPGLRLRADGLAAVPLRTAVTASYGFGGIHAAAVLTAPDPQEETIDG